MESDKTIITQDILKANGFEYDDEGFLLYKKHHSNPDFASDCIIRVGESEALWDEKDTVFEFKIDNWPDYVELHTKFLSKFIDALRLCGIDELADQMLKNC